MTHDFPYGRLDIRDAHSIAKNANALITAMQEYVEAGAETDGPEAKLARKGVEMGDALLDLARLLVSRGVFSHERYISEILIYSAAIVDNCEVCALTHIEGAVLAKAPESVIDAVKAIALYVLAQADDDTYLLFDTYTKYWRRFESWPRLSSDLEANLKFYNLVALLMSLVVRKRRLVRLHTLELLTRTNVSPAEILEIIGIAQIMGGFPSRWEAVHILDVAMELKDGGQLPDTFNDLLALIPTPAAKG